MSINTIVAPMTGGPTDRPALDAALTMAGPTNAHIQAVFLYRDPKHIALPQVGEGMTAGMIDTLVEAAERQVRGDRAAAHASYDEWRRTNAVSELESPSLTNGITAQLTEAQGEMSASLVTTGRMADVVCMVQPGKDDDAELSNLTTAALMETGKMIYLAPRDKTTEPIKSIAIAWNGSREAARAVAMTMPILESAETVTVLAGTSAYLTPADVNAFITSLKWHGIDAKSRMFTMNGDQSGRLQAEAMEAGAQVLVLGAYSHSRMREFVFGGVTDDIIYATDMPVLMAH